MNSTFQCNTYAKLYTPSITDSGMVGAMIGISRMYITHTDMKDSRKATRELRLFKTRTCTCVYANGIRKI